MRDVDLLLRGVSANLLIPHTYILFIITISLEGLSHTYTLHFAFSFATHTSIHTVLQALVLFGMEGLMYGLMLVCMKIFIVSVCGFSAFLRDTYCDLLCYYLVLVLLSVVVIGNENLGYMDGWMIMNRLGEANYIHI